MEDELPLSDRTRKGERRYQDDKARGLTKRLIDEPIVAKLTNHWHLKRNAYPYDQKWEWSDMIVYYKECEWIDIPRNDLADLVQIETTLLAVYDRISRNGVVLQSIASTPHVHLLRGLKE